GSTQRATAVKHRAGYADLLQVAAQTAKWIRGARQERKALLEDLPIGQRLLQVHQQRVQRGGLAGFAQVAYQPWRIHFAWLGFEQASVQSAQRALDAGAEPVIAFDSFDRTEPIQI